MEKWREKLLREVGMESNRYYRLEAEHTFKRCDNISAKFKANNTFLKVTSDLFKMTLIRLNN